MKASELLLFLPLASVLFLAPLHVPHGWVRAARVTGER